MASSAFYDDNGGTAIHKSCDESDGTAADRPNVCATYYSQHFGNGDSCLLHSGSSLSYFCQQHDKDMCEVCARDNHQNCNVATKAKIRRNFSRYLNSVKRIRFDIEDHKEELRNYSDNVKSHLHISGNKIKAAFAEIADRMKETEKGLLEKLDTIGQAEILALSNIFDESAELEETIENIIDRGEKLNRNTVQANRAPDSSNQRDSDRPVIDSSLQADGMAELMKFLTNHEEEVGRIRVRLKSMSKMSLGNCENMAEKNNDIITNLYTNISNVISFNPLHTNVNENSDTETYPKTSTHEVNVLNTRPSISEDRIGEVTLDRELTCNGRACAINFTPSSCEELLVVTWRPNRVQHLNPEGHLLKSVDLPDWPFDLCTFGFNVAVTIPNKRQITIYRYDMCFTSRTQIIQLPDDCHGICRKDEGFLVTFMDKYIVRYIDDNSKVMEESDAMLNRPKFVTTSACKNYVLVSDAGNQIVILSGDLKRVLNIATHSELQEPCGLCISGGDQVYVCSQGGNRILELTKDGKIIGTILSDKHRLTKYPRSICYNANTRMLVVAPNTWWPSSTIQIFRTK